MTDNQKTNKPPLKPLRPSGPWEYADAEEGYEYSVSVDCNKMSYPDGDGVWHEIYMPAGTAGKAGQHLVNKEWEDLAKFPTWDNQKYKDEDYMISKYKINPETGDMEESVVVKKQGEPLIKTADGRVIVTGRSADAEK